jgi:hypothetical protein
VAKKGKTWRPPAQPRGGQARRGQPQGRTRTDSPDARIDDLDVSDPPATTRPRTEVVTEQPETTTPNRQARKEEARRQREMLRRKAARRRLIGRILGIAGALVVVAGVVLGILLLGGGKPQIPQDLPGIQKDTEPWPPELTHLQQRLRKIGIGFLGTEQQVLHIHQHLDVFVNGSQVQVPQDIGIIGGTGLAFIHTHDASGVIHVESPTARRYTLGNVFDIWGVLFTPDCLGAYCNQGNDRVRVFVDGKRVTGDPRTVALKNFQEIVVTYGTPQQLPKPIPKTYAPFEQLKEEARKARKKAQATPTPTPSGATPSPSST